MNESDLQYFERLAADYEDMGSSATASDFRALIAEVRRLQGQVDKYSARCRQALIASASLHIILGGKD